MANTARKDEKVNFSEIVIDGIQKNRKILVITGIVIIVLIVGFVAGLSIRDSLEANAISKIEAFNERYEALRFDINDPSKEEEVNTLVDELSAYTPKAFGYSAVRAYMLTASIQADRKNWQEAKTAWAEAARKGGGKSYLVPVSLFNAGVAAEEAGDIEEAITYYTEVLTFADFFPQPAKAQFSIGRLREEQQNKEAAIAAYRELIEKWPTETIWINLANSRIIALSGLNS
jgi:tetratricopeptide (TPR) repeat protein